MILVTGGAGFIGGNFVLDWLAQCDEPVVNLDKLTYAGNLESLQPIASNTRYEFVQADIADQPLVSAVLERAREHGELEGAFKSVGESLEATCAKLGLEMYGEANEPFDPAVHEALTSETREGLEGPIVTSVYQRGYRHAGRVLRPDAGLTQQGNAEPVEGFQQPPAEIGEGPGQQGNPDDQKKRPHKPLDQLHVTLQLCHHMH